MMMMKICTALALIHIVFDVVRCDDCRLKSASPVEQNLLKRLNAFKGKSFQTNNSEYNFYLTICDVPKEAIIQNDSAGLIQAKLNDQSTQYALGRLNNVDLEGSDTWIRMTYQDGDKYGTVCNKTKRKAVIYLTCNDQIGDKFSILEENHDRYEDCAYVFELKTQLLCSNESTRLDTTVPPMGSVPTTSGLGVFSILLICVSSLFAVYLIAGVLYMRFVRKARGWQQMPNFVFWNRIGNIQADLCDYMCRCNGAHGRNGAQPYESLSGQQLSDDENILNI